MWWWLACTAPTSPPEVPPPVPVSPAPPSGGEDRVSYTLSFDERAHHRVAVELVAQCPADGLLTLWMPVWTPGSYLIREYSRLVDGVHAGEQPAEKVAKNRWAIACDRSPVVVKYDLVGRAWSVRENTIEADFAVLTGAATFLIPQGSGAFRVGFTLPDGFTVAAGLPRSDDGTFLADSVDALVDSPFLVGALAEASVTVKGVLHRVIAVGDRADFDVQAVASDAGKLARVVHELFGRFPYDRYTFFVLVGGPGSGGLEHANGSLVSVAAGRDPKDAGLRGLFAHELFHAWNGKAVRPVGLGPFDYEAEVYTDALWVVEGVTAYYDDVLPVRAGLTTEADALTRLSEALRKLDATPGRLRQPLDEASFDAWIGHYRADEDTPNRGVDYYLKGAVVAWLLDAEIRRATSDTRSLDDVMRALATQYADRPYTTADFRSLAGTVAGVDLAPFFDRAVAGVADLDYGPALHWFGLRFAPQDEVGPGDLGPLPATRDGRLVFDEVLRGTPAWTAGVSVGDELLALNDRQVTPASLADVLKTTGPGWSGTLLVARRGRLLRLPITLGTALSRTLENDPGAAPQALRRRAGWLR